MIEGFVVFLWLFGLVCFQLVVVVGQVDFDCDVEDVCCGIGDGDVCIVFVDCEYQFDFVLEIGGCRWVGDGCVVQDDGICGFLKEEWWLVFIFVYFVDMFYIVLFDIVDLVYGEQLIVVGDWNGCDWDCEWIVRFRYFCEFF